MFTIITHEEQYKFNCVIMDSQNSNTYIQQQMNIILKDANGDSYCDDIVIYSDTRKNMSANSPPSSPYSNSTTFPISTQKTPASHPNFFFQTKIFSNPSLIADSFLPANFVPERDQESSSKTHMVSD